jgi:hypothetical protein
MLLLGERRNTSSEWGVRVLWFGGWERKECRARKVVVRRWVGVRIWGRRG